MNVSGVIFFPLGPKKPRSKKKITPDLRLGGEGRSLHDKDVFKTRNGEMTNVEMAKQ